MEKLKTCLGYLAEMDQASICCRLNNGNYLPLGVFPNTIVNYHRTADQSVNDFHNDQAINNNPDNFKNVIIASLDTGWAPFFLTSTGGAPYKSLPGGAHYVCIIGYDEIGGFVLVSNCHNEDNIMGIYAVSSDSIYNCIDTLFYALPTGT
jgi:hypothetical protein